MNLNSIIPTMSNNRRSEIPMKFNKIYLEPKAETLAHQLLVDWKNSYVDCAKEWHEFGRSIGATGVIAGDHRRPRGYAFEGDSPEGWTKPDSKGRSHPYAKNAEARAKLKALPEPECLDKLCNETLGLPLLMREGEYTVGISFYPFQTWRICWAGDRVFIYADDWHEKFADFKVTHPNGVLDGKIPDDLQVISKARVDLAFAEHKVLTDEAA